MSYYEHYRGNLNKVERLENESLEYQCKRLLEEEMSREVFLPDYYDSYGEMLVNEFYGEYYVYNGILYSMYREFIDSDGDIFNANEGENGAINFEVRYWNGGCGFNEAIKRAVENIK